MDWWTNGMLDECVRERDIAHTYNATCLCANWAREKERERERKRWETKVSLRMHEWIKMQFSASPPSPALPSSSSVLVFNFELMFTFSKSCPPTRTQKWSGSIVSETSLGSCKRQPKNSLKSPANSETKFRYNRGAAVAQWIRLRLPSCRQRVESSAHHLCFYQFIFELYNLEKTKINFLDFF